MRLTLIFLLLSIGLSCSIRKPSVENPIPDSPTEISKSFFQMGSDNGSLVRKKFAVAWAPVMGEGSYYDNMFPATPMSRSVNIKFEITDNFLVARQARAGIKDIRKEKIIFTIPIIKHYYNEKAKDEYQRDTNDYIENDGRSDPLARPEMELNLAGISIKDKSSFFFDSNAWGEVISVDRNSVDQSSNPSFLGFTINTVHTEGRSGGQVNIRLNIMEIDESSNQDFTPTLFSPYNERYFSSLFADANRDVNGNTLIYVSKWDLSVENTVHIVGFPDEYYQMAHDSIVEWNKIIKEISQGKLKPFKIVRKSYEDQKGFDIRYPSVTWVDDSDQSTGVLGIASVVSNNTNGKILWGNASIFGAILRRIAVWGEPGSENYNPVDTKTENHVWYENKINEFISSLKGYKNISLTNYNANNALADFIGQNKSFRMQSPFQDLQSSLRTSSSHNTNEDLWELIHQGHTKIQNNETKNHLNETTQNKNKENSVSTNHFLFRTIKDVEEQILPIVKNMDREQIEDLIKKIIKEVIVHEWGHVLGLGHNFKGSIMPKEDEVPSDELNKLKEELAHSNIHSHNHSIMDYSDMAMYNDHSYEQIRPGLYDKNVLRYVYMGEVPTMKKGDKSYIYKKIDPYQKVIPDKFEDDRKPSFAPYCNDFHAYLADDIYCSRFDSGQTAYQIAHRNIDLIMRSIRATRHAGILGMRSDRANYYYSMWSDAFSKLGKLRVFYDYMRYHYGDKIMKILDNDEEKYRAFSCHCNTLDTDDLNKNSSCQLNETYPEITELLEQNPELSSLCKATKATLNLYENILDANDPDDIKYDNDFAYAPILLTSGVDVDLGHHAFGAWREMTLFPYKFAALYNMMGAIPYNMMPWNSISKYTRDTGYFSYYTLFPTEYVSILKTAAKKSLKFPTQESSEGPRVGKVLPLITSFLRWLSPTNDNIPIDLKYSLANQTRFKISSVFLVLTGKYDSSGTERVKTFSGYIYDHTQDIGGEKPKLEYAYLLPQNRVMAKAEGNSLIFSDDQFIPFSATDTEVVIVVPAIQMHFPDSSNKLEMKGIREMLVEEFKKQVDLCIIGTDNNLNGLQSYFSAEKQSLNAQGFEGFYFGRNIVESKNAITRSTMTNSIQEEFEKYWEFKGQDDPDGFRKICEDSYRSIQMIGTVAAMLNGYWLEMGKDYFKSGEFE